MREIRTLRAMWRALETEPRQLLTGHEEGNLGYKPRRDLRANAPALDPTSDPLQICRSIFRTLREQALVYRARDFGQTPVGRS